MIGLHVVRQQKFISTGFKYVYRSLPLTKMHLSVCVCDVHWKYVKVF